jgi:hypothetical protein
MSAGCASPGGADGTEQTSAALKIAAATSDTVATVRSPSARVRLAADVTTDVAGAQAAPSPRPLDAAAAGLNTNVVSSKAAPSPERLYVSDANDVTTILTDSDRYWATWFGDADELAVEAGIGAQFGPDFPTPVWGFGAETSALVQMYDLVAPLDTARALKYLARLRSYGNAYLANRDDVRGFPADAFRHRVMPAWGAYAHNRDDRWNTDVSITGLFTYAMAAFSRRVLENPALLADNPTLQAQYRSDAIRYVTAVLDSYEAFRSEMHLDDADSEAYFTVPHGYAFLTCSNGAHGCETYRDTADEPIAYNENLAMMKALAEVALASDTALYRASPDANWLRLYRSTYEAPLLVAKNFAFFDHHLESKTLSDGTPYFVWNHQLPTDNRQDTSHGGFEVACLGALLDDKYALDQLLTANGRSEQLGLSTPLFVRFANTFLRKIWNYDFTNPDPSAPGQNLLDTMIDGSGDHTESSNANTGCAGWAPLTPFSPWVWIRCRDATFHDSSNKYLTVDNHAALLRYRP